LPEYDGSSDGWIGNADVEEDSLLSQSFPDSTGVTTGPLTTLVWLLLVYAELANGDDDDDEEEEEKLDRLSSLPSSDIENTDTILDATSVLLLSRGLFKRQ
jgi:hypothetical protein